MSSAPPQTAIDSGMNDGGGVLPYEAPPPPSPEPNLRSRTIRGSIWTMAGYGLSQMIRLASNLILTRLLFPEIFGLMALVNVFLQGLTMFSDIGIGPAIIQNKRGDDDRFLNTAWTIQIGRGLMLWGASWLIAFPVAHFYEKPELMLLIPVSGLCALLDGFASTSIFTLRRHMHLAKLTVFDLITQVSGLAVGITWTFYQRDIWPLVFGGIFAALTRAVLSHFLVKQHRNRLAWDKTAASELFRFGRWIFVSTVVAFLAAQCDRMIFGKLVTFERLGIYSIALTLATLPTQLLLRVGSAVVFPAFSRVRNTRSDLPAVYKRVRFPLLVLGGWIVSCLIASGPQVICVMYDKRYWEAGWMVQVLALSAWFQILECTIGAALLAVGATLWVAMGNAAKLVGFAVVVPAGYWLWRRYVDPNDGFPGGVVGLAIAEGMKWSVSLIGAHENKLKALNHDVLLSVLGGCSVALGMGAVVLLRHTFTLNNLAAVGIAVICVTIPWLPLLYRSLQSMKRQQPAAMPAIG